MTDPLGPTTTAALGRVRRIWLGASVTIFGLALLGAIAVRNPGPAIGLGLVSALFLCGYSWLTGFGTGSAEVVEVARTQRHTECEIEIEINHLEPGEGYIYALKFATGTIKVGQTNDLSRRVNEHRRDAGAYGVVIVDYWFSGPHLGYQENEAALIAWCSDIAWRSKREYFHGIGFRQVADFALTLTQVRAAV